MVKKTKTVTKPVGKANPTVAASPSVQLVPTLKSTALSVDVGPVVIAALAEAYKMEVQATQLKASGEARKHDSLRALTYGIWKLAKADNSVDLTAVYDEDKSANKARLNNQVYMALGFKIAQEVKGKRKAIWAESVAPFISVDGPADPLGVQKEKVRTNLAHQITKAIQSAETMIAQKMEVKEDKKAGTLLLSGPAIKSHFGEASVLLNEKQTVDVLDKKGNKTGTRSLKAKPSYSEIAKMGAESHGKVFTKRVDSRAVAQDPDKWLSEMCSRLVQAIEKMSKPTDVQRTALESVQNAIEKLLG